LVHTTARMPPVQKISNSIRAVSCQVKTVTRNSKMAAFRAFIAYVHEIYQFSEARPRTGPRPHISGLNIRSISHPLHTAALSDTTDSHHPVLFCLIETCIKTCTTSTELINCTPPNYTLLSFPRSPSQETVFSAIDGGTGFLIREPFTELPFFLFL